MSPEVAVGGRSICVTSPVMIILAFIPRRVRNILIWCVVVFWASSRMMTASFSVRPRIKASGAIWITLFSMYSFSLAPGTMSCRASYRGWRYGSSLSFISPGRNPNFSPASTAGRLRIILRISLFFSAFTARAMAINVLPVPAGPVAKTRSFSSNALTRRCWFSVRATIGLPFIPWMIRFSCLVITGALPLMMSSMTSSLSELNSSQYFSTSRIFLRKSSDSSSSPITFITFPLATMRSLGNNVLINCMLTLFTP